MEKEQRNSVVFNASKRELFTANNGYKFLQKRLRAQWKIQSIKEELSLERLNDVKLWITAGSREKFTAAELEVLKQYLDVGGNVLVMLREGGELKALTFVYPYGATLSVMKPAVAVLSTGSVCFPLNRPVLAFYQVKDVVFQWLMGDNIHLNQIDAEDPGITNYTMLPDTGCLSERLRVCLQEGEENPRDFTSPFDMSLLKLSTNTLSQVISSYMQMNVKHESLQLITPQFETPLPQL
ncbi:unnamed protein product [Coregonus sp. 'balchen']|nr:unnamed protein product [Coregonus sp. 'balchen']